MTTYDENELLISTEKSKLNLDTIMGFLAKSYWANKRSPDKMKMAIENSICYGVYIGDKQIGFARVVTDHATMYWLADVFVDEAYRGQNIGKQLIETITTSPELKNLMGVLGTRDAHGLYEQYEFNRDQERFMRRMPDYLRNLER
ncbi:GNAT family N-acetyltransferase [Paenibacillus koleovorans]|uniref:GNAT family N-acetyltransferase n=1 Tax=Paenibacillus koleovorans TaxID=121608 RepID=UPI000FD91BF9|nr:GNAT family N-acetyltransferase [Paenibacillus koleovorans]